MTDLLINRIINGKQVLLIDDHTNIRKALRMTLEQEGAIVAEASSLAAGRQALADQNQDLILLDVRLPDGSGLDVLRELSRNQRASRVIVISGEASFQDAYTATQLGAFDYIEKPFSPQRIVVSASRCLSFNEVNRDNAAMRERLAAGGASILGESVKVRELTAMIQRVAPTESGLLIVGESGTGKELVAKEIHRLSARAAQPMIKINCAAIPNSLVESELFGHEKGAFTGATKTHLGVFERAHQGTLFLDEVAELEPSVQAKLLRVLQSGELTRVGGDKSLTVNVRVIVATNQELTALVAAGKFREDLFYRLNGILLRVPPLRERTGDITLLASHFLVEACQRHSLGRRQFSPTALETLSRLPWRGNIRELKNYVEKISILSDEITINSLLDLPEEADAVVIPGGIPSESSDEFLFKTPLVSWQKFHQNCDGSYIKFVLSRTGGNVSEAARILCLERPYLHRLMKKLGIQKGITVT